MVDKPDTGKSGQQRVGAIGCLGLLLALGFCVWTASDDAPNGVGKGAPLNASCLSSEGYNPSFVDGVLVTLERPESFLHAATKVVSDKRDELGGYTIFMGYQALSPDGKRKAMTAVGSLDPETCRTRVLAAPIEEMRVPAR
jgi:hypothetical protein